MSLQGFSPKFQWINKLIQCDSTKNTVPASYEGLLYLGVQEAHEIMNYLAFIELCRVN